MRKKSVTVLIISSLLLSAAAHFFFIQEWFNGRFMIGPNDGLSQMAPFKKFIYDQYSQGNFFYSWSFGLGGGFYSQLAYYFSTSIIFFMTAGIVFSLETIGLISHPDLLFWMNTILPVSIIRLSLIILTAAFAFRYMGIRTTAAFTGAAVYGLSVMYFRHVVFWEFFTDAMLWLPLLVIGTEKIIREGKPGWFIVAWSLMFFNNFYFAYIHLIFLFIYIAFRWIVPLSRQEYPKHKQLFLFFLGGVISFCIGAVSFIPAVYGFLHNYRPAYEEQIPFFFITDNILHASKYIILPAILVLFLFLVPLYKERTYRFFALLTILFIVFHFSPLAASAFNGFSAPQYRWEYLLSFTAGGCVAAGLQSLHKVRMNQLLLSIIISFGLYLFMAEAMTYVMGPKLIMMFEEQMDMIIQLFFLAALLLCLYVWRKHASAFFLLQLVIIISGLVIVNGYEQMTMSEKFGVDRVSRETLQDPAYNGAEQQQLIKKIQHSEQDPLVRIDWMNPLRNNTPLVQDFNGTSLYSSIFNEELLFFYWRDLQIDMGRESVSRYATLGNRANLYGLLQTNYWMREKAQAANVPYGFEPFAESAHYVAYKNTLPLPFIRTARHVFYEKDLKNRSPLDKEHAMLSGIVLDKKNGKSDVLTTEKNIIDAAIMKEKNAAYKNGQLKVTKDNGGIVITPRLSSEKTKDYYVQFYIENVHGKGFAVKVNQYRTTRKRAASIYKTGIHTVLIRVPKEKHIAIQLPKGTYKLKHLKLYEEDYRELQQAAAEKRTPAKVNWNKNKISITYDNHTGERYMALPIPFEKGWQLKINKETKEIEKANFAFIGFPLEKGTNHIELTYRPPFFNVSLVLLVLGLLAAVWLIRNQANKNQTS
ncbi:hypothetical protein AC623_10425 [Bacillus sp. FJAT-27231]|uniref:YfhO family protein n=1 Tax=Bacillus sp. FJAT-27231 TaxID=1679168 RepID=UPI000670CFDD|nr:YfhO family protein [Bacillus sp. FJAT-27231]KMY54291.1 hypothetical protein AC623_10425 [Bacillus sp. FJAT-27231]